MKYAKEVNSLFGAHPGRDWRMAEIVRYISPGAEGRERQRIRVGVLRVLTAFAEHGLINIRPPRAATGGFALYRVKPKKRYTQLSQTDSESATMAASEIASRDSAQQ